MFLWNDFEIPRAFFGDAEQIIKQFLSSFNEVLIKSKETKVLMKCMKFLRYFKGILREFLRNDYEILRIVLGRS